MNNRGIGRGITLEVRRSHPDDATLRALSQVAEEELRSTSREGVSPRGLATYRWLVNLASSDSAAEITGILADLNGGTVGMGVVVRNKDSALLHSVFVATAFRGIGVGRAIVQEARSVTDGLVLRTLALPGDRRTKNLFEQSGMPAQLIVAGREINEPSSSEHASR
jgi:GNAT superfamily N-acetyltransferase